MADLCQKLRLGALLLLALGSFHPAEANLLPPWASNGDAFNSLPPPAFNEEATKVFMDMKLDHFSNEDARVFALKHYVDTSSWDRTSDLAFISIGGEGPVDGIQSTSFFSVLARKHGALQVASEHRFYGESVPYNNQSVPMLKYLSVDQALEDVRTVMEEVEKVHNAGRPLRWVTFGGSYPGALSAWFRIRYPDKAIGALASSAVVTARLRFPEFDEHVAEAAGPSCASDIRAVNRAMERGLACARDREVKGLFGAAHLADPDFWYMTADSAAMAVQYGHKTKLCAQLATVREQVTQADGGACDDPRVVELDSVIIRNFANFTNTLWGKDFGQGCFYDSDCLKYNEPLFGMARPWRWQKCSELAYFQVAPDPERSLRSSTLSLEALMDQCRYIFGEDIHPHTHRVNEVFGGPNPKGSRIFFTDFSDDPWMTTTVDDAALQGREGDEIFHCVARCDDCGHCGDLKAPNDTDAEPIKECRQQFTELLGKWVGVKKTEVDTPTKLAPAEQHAHSGLTLAADFARHVLSWFTGPSPLVL